ncbi:beta-lactamase family protein [uncultured Psychroserpens sp.]|uniref:beta-lactamase family protein n=1 Tax=uncultured Psychroserpens sp. TaxID=255436 RepID=UPI00261AD96E|nr:beta-lactamase family protein [uncultured Psychroserpens sp.]
MKHIISVLFIIVLFQSCTEKSNSDTTTDLTKRVETGLTTRIHIEGDSTWSIEERMEHYGIPGVSIAVIHHGEIAWTKAYGVVDKESKVPVTEHTLFQAAATSMPVTAYGALRFVEQHKLDLDEDVNSYLKSWKVPENEFNKESKVTIRNLLNHSAGIYPRGTGSYSINEEIPTLVEILNGAFPATNEPITVNKEPGESVRFAYASYVPIQQMMLDVEEKTFPEIMHEFVLQPLEMNNSTFNQSLTKEQLAMAATGYLSDGSMVEGRRHISPSMASSGLWTTAEDYAKFITNVQQTLDGKYTKGLSKDLTELMGTPYGVDNSTWSFTLGLGFQLLNRKDEIYLRHHGWNTGFYTEIVAHRDKGYGVVVMTNSTFPEFNAEVIRSVAQTYNWDNYVPVYKKMKIEQSLVDEITGRYESDNVTVEVFEKDNLLFYKNILDVEAHELIKVSDSNFVRRNSSRFIQFKPNSEDETINLVHFYRSDWALAATFVKTDTDKKEPVEFLLEGDFENALKAYRTLIEHDSTNPRVAEDHLNDIGYDFYHDNRMKLAQNTFKLNVMLYPKSFKVYESYAKACAKIGDINLAILNYSKSLELNPQNNEAKYRLTELQKSK